MPDPKEIHDIGELLDELDAGDQGAAVPDTIE